MPLPYHAALFLALLLALLCELSRAGPASVVMTDANSWHGHAPGAPFTISVRPSWSGAGSVYYQWQTANKVGFAAPVALPNGISTSLNSPDGLSGYIQLVLTADAPIFLPDMTVGEPLYYGFFTANPRPSAVVPNTYFGTVHTNDNDPYVPPWGKNIWWPGETGAGWNAALNYARAKGKFEFGLFTQQSATGAQWSTTPNDNSQISQTQLNAIYSAARDIFQTAYAGGRNADQAIVELGLVENLSPNFGQTYYFQNLAAKAQACRQAATDSDAANVQFAYQVVGWQTQAQATDDFYAFLSSPAAAYFQVLAVHPYAWENNFAYPDGWMPTLITQIKSWMTALGQVKAIQFTEVGVPQNDPPVASLTSIRGYHDSYAGYTLAGVTKGYAASYLFRTNIVAISLGVQRLFWFNHQDNWFERADAEANFGLRDYYGYPEPMLAAFYCLQTHFDLMAFTNKATLPGNVQVYQFQGNGNAIFALWTYPTATTTVSLADIKPGLDSTQCFPQISAAYDRVYRPLTITGNALTVTEDPIMFVTTIIAPTTATTSTVAATAAAAAAAAAAIAASTTSTTASASTVAAAAVAAAANAAASTSTTAASTAAAAASAAAAANSASNAATSSAAANLLISVEVASTSASTALATTAAASVIASTAGSTASVSALASMSVTSSVSATTSTIAASVALTTAAASGGAAAAASTAAASASASSTVAATTSAMTSAGASNNAIASTSGAATAATSNAALSVSTSTASTTNAAFATTAATSAASTAAVVAVGSVNGAAATSATASAAASAQASVSATSVAAAAASGTSLSASSIAATTTVAGATTGTVDSVTSAAATAAAIAASTASASASVSASLTGTPTGNPTTGNPTTGSKEQIWYIMAETSTCIDIAALFSALETVCSLPNERFLLDKYDGCKKRNQMLVMHVSNDRDGDYARQIVNYLLGGSWPSVTSAFASDKMPSSKKGGLKLKFWVWIVIGVIGLLVVAGIIAAVYLIIRVRNKEDFHENYVQMSDQTVKEELYKPESNKNPTYGKKQLHFNA